MATSMHELSPDPSSRRWGPACMNFVQTLSTDMGTSMHELNPDPSYRRWGPACMNLVQTLAIGDGDQHA